MDLNFNVVAGELTSQAIVGGAALDFDKSSTVSRRPYGEVCGVSRDGGTVFNSVKGLCIFWETPVCAGAGIHSMQRRRAYGASITALRHRLQIYAGMHIP